MSCLLLKRNRALSCKTKIIYDIKMGHILGKFLYQEIGIHAPWSKELAEKLKTMYW